MREAAPIQIAPLDSRPRVEAAVGGGGSGAKMEGVPAEVLLIEPEGGGVGLAGTAAPLEADFDRAAAGEDDMAVVFAVGEQTEGVVLDAMEHVGGARGHGDFDRGIAGVGPFRVVQERPAEFAAELAPG